MTVSEQLAFPLVIRRAPSATIRERVDELAGLLSIDHLLDRGPAGLSGGERQRIALGRALSFHPSILLLDEPLAALDEDTHGQIIRLLKTVQQYTGVTTLHVTHNVSEARRLGDLHLRIEGGSVRQFGIEETKEEPA
jgi:ABC-type sugar transport system ATPase subunit